MILNPPPVCLLLRTWSLIETQVPELLRAEYLAALFRRCLRPDLTYGQFLETHHLFLQDIPLETAKEAWGIHHANSQLTATTP